MKQLIIVCTVLLLVQIGLFVTIHIGRQGDEVQTGKGLLLALPSGEVNELLLEDGEGQQLRLQKQQDKWVLPELDSFPADSARIQGMVDRLIGMRRGWPEATTAEAAGRFKVAPDRFERRLSLRRDGAGLAVVYFGTSPGLRKMYLRVDGDPDIQTIGLTAHELETKADAWIDTAILRLAPDKVAQVELPAVNLTRGEDGLRPADLAPEEELVTEKRDQLVKRLCGLTILAVLGTESKTEYGLDKPVLRYRVQLADGTAIEYLFGQIAQDKAIQENKGVLPAAEQSLVVKVSNQAQLFRMDGWQIEEIINATRTGLVRAKTGVPTAAQPVDSQPGAGEKEGQ